MIKDKGLGRELLTLSDLLGEEPPAHMLEGVTIRPTERARIKRFDDTGKAKDGAIAGLGQIKFWVVLDCGEKDKRWIPANNPYDNNVQRPDRYIPVGVAVDQDIADVEREEKGVALPEIYLSWDEACEVSSDLCIFSRIHES